MKQKSVAIFVIAYRAVRTLISAIDRIPPEIKERAKEIYVFDDFSDDNTYYAGLGYKHKKNIEKLKIYRNEKNLGYGGNQKVGYNYAIKKDFDIVVMLHGDVQYAPEKIPLLLEPLDKGEADAVFGSRILGGSPIKQGMPVWKYIGNRILTAIENSALGLNLSEYHSGFRAYSCEALKRLPLDKLFDGYHFDTEIIIEMKKAGMRIKEVPIPTHYGPESHQISFFKAMNYGIEILKLMLAHRKSNKS